MTDAPPDTQIIKQAIAFRAKYATKRQASMQRLCCDQIVPHPSNRGGEAVRSTRTKGLAGDICFSGFLTSEAETSSICVEAGPDNPSRFQDHFKKNCGGEPDHYVGNTVACYGGLTHNTLNVVNRNIRYGMPGCACEPKPAAVAAECKCTAKRMLEENKNGGLVYSMEKLREHDLDWFVYINAGAMWEILSSDMDVEEPDAAHIIALAYNDKNQVAMATGHLEMMRYLQSLCTPDPSTELHWDAILLSMQKRFGKHNMADIANYHHAYKLMVVSGGSDSLTWKDFFRWAAIFCDESKTQIKLDTYSVLASYPIEFRHIAKMLRISID